MIKRGTNTIRRNARNFTHDIAQRRLEEAIVPFKQQILNSLEVDAVEIAYFNIQRKVGAACSCTMDVGNVEQTGRSQYETTVPNKHSEEKTANIKFQDDNIFGNDLGQRIFQDDLDDETLFTSEGSIDLSGGSRFETNELGMQMDVESFAQSSGSVNCGICYRTGHVPPFKPVNTVRTLLTYADLVDADLYFVNKTVLPYCVERHAPDSDCWAKFEITVPRFFKSVGVSIRDNLMHLPEYRLEDRDGNAIDLRFMKANAGKTVAVYCSAPRFTHIIIDFEFDVAPIKANISQEGQSLDYNRLITIGDIQVTLPPTLAHVENGDLLVVKNRNLVLLVRDKQWKATADRNTFGWTASTRVVQTSESFRNINLSNKLR